jgi:hypothetical protein
MYQKPSVPRSIGGVLDDTLQLYKASFRNCLPPALLGGVALAASSFYQVSSQPAVTGAATGVQALLGTGSAAAPLSTLFSLLSGLLELVCYGAMIYCTWAVSQGETSSFGRAFGLAWRRLLAMIGAGMIIGIVGGIGFVVALVPVFISMGGRAPNASLQQVVAQMLPAILISLVLLIPVAYVVTRMSLYMVPLVAESRGAGESVGTSWRLVGGNWWRTSTVLFVIFAIIYLLAAALIAIADSVTVLAMGGVKGGTQAAGAVALVTTVLVGLVRIVIAPLTAAGFVTIYQDLLLRKGGGDLEARLGALPKG